MSSSKQSSRMMQTSNWHWRNHHYFLVRLMPVILLGMVAVYLHPNLNGSSSYDDVQGRFGIDKLLNEPVSKEEEESILDELALAETTQEEQEGEGANHLIPSLANPLPLASPSTKSAKAKGDSKSKGSKSKGGKSKSKGSKSKSKKEDAAKAEKHDSKSKSAKAKSNSKSKKAKSATKGSAKAGKSAEKSKGGEKSTIKSAKATALKDDLEFEDEMGVVGVKTESFGEGDE